MKRKLFLSCVIFLLLASDAIACGRCGLFGRRCRFRSSVHHHNVVRHDVIAVQQPQTIALQVNYPPLPVQGGTGYIYSGNSSIDASLHLNQAARLVERAQDLASHATTDFSATLQAAIQGQQNVAEIVASGQAASAALLATTGVKSASTDAVTVTLRIKDGRVEVVREKRTDKPEVITSDNAVVQPSKLAVCLRCHSGEGAKAGFRLDESLNFVKYKKARAQMRSGNMPPKDSGVQLSEEDIVLIEDSLLTRVSQ